MRALRAFLLLTISTLGITGCGGKYDDRGTLTVTPLGDGTAEITGANGIFCPGTCEQEYTFSRAQITNIRDDRIYLKANIEIADDSEHLGWLLSGQGFYSTDLKCDTGPTCDFAMTEFCSVPVQPGVSCYENGVRDLELRPVVMKKDTLIDWSWKGRALCVLKQPGEVQCWEDYEDQYRSFELATPPMLTNPTQVENDSGYACVLDQTGVHCWTRPGIEIVTEPSVRFGLRNVEQIAVLQNVTLKYGCALWENQVTCWVQNEQAQVPELVAPTNMGRENFYICVDDGDERVCWRNAYDPVSGLGEYVEYRRPLDSDSAPLAD